MYLENSKMFEAQIPNVNKSGLSKHCAHIFEGMSFTKKLFENIEVIGQIDLKFIASVERSKNLLILFDQHAVHERVRLEMLNEGNIYNLFNSNYPNQYNSLQERFCFIGSNDNNFLTARKLGLN